ncbi:MAG: TIM44-like domain-containing protein [Planctomycetaceae bacterium]|nr:TIM44-like domain-containing protein [Planctomycetaceae bacterium]
MLDITPVNLCSSPLAWYCTFSVALLAQAGGGGNYGGGSSGGSGGDSGGNGSGEAIYWLIRFTIHYPQYGIPLWILIAALFYYGKKSGTEYHVTRTIRRGRKVQEDSLRTSAIASIHQHDPDFDQETFLQRVANGFVATQEAWSEQDLRRCRAFISDGVRERFELYIAMQKAENIRNRMKNVDVRENEIVSITSDRHFDTIHVRITASAISYNEDLRTGQRVSGNSDRLPISFTEVWSFSRRPGVKTDSRASILSGRCPNCGGPVKIVDKAECPQCHSIVNSGQYDWVLAEITQHEEWVVPPVQHAVSDWDELQKRDPGLNFQHLEDRASVIFWRSMMAVYFEDLRYAAPVLDTEARTVPKLWAQNPGEFWKTPAVGVVEVVRCVPARGDEFDRIFVLVRWSATKAQGDRVSPTLIGMQRIYSHVLVLKRKSGATSKADQAFASFSCTGCGASIDIGRASECSFCGAALNDGSGDWILEDVTPHNPMEGFQDEDRRDQVIAQQGGVERLETDRFLNEPELLTALARILTVDGELHEKERQHINALAERRGVPESRLKTIFATAASNEIPITVPEDRQQANSFMEHLLRAALVDGKVTRSEQDLLLQAGSQIGWTAADLKIALGRTRTDLYQQAKKIIRQRRRE